jgi:hypothetical protein
MTNALKALNNPFSGFCLSQLEVSTSSGKNNGFTGQAFKASGSRV